jgi:hypothetical protein
MSVVEFKKGQGVYNPGLAPLTGVIEACEWALALAKSGNARAIAIAVVIADGTDYPMAETEFYAAPFTGSRLENAITKLNRAVGKWLDE